MTQTLDGRQRNRSVRARRNQTDRRRSRENWCRFAPSSDESTVRAMSLPVLVSHRVGSGTSILWAPDGHAGIRRPRSPGKAQPFLSVGVHLAVVWEVKPWLAVIPECGVSTLEFPFY